MLLVSCLSSAQAAHCWYCKRRCLHQLEQQLGTEWRHEREPTVPSRWRRPMDVGGYLSSCVLLSKVILDPCWCACWVAVTTESRPSTLPWNSPRNVCHSKLASSCCPQVIFSLIFLLLQRTVPLASCLAVPQTRATATFSTADPTRATCSQPPLSSVAETIRFENARRDEWCWMSSLSGFISFTVNVWSKRDQSNTLRFLRLELSFRASADAEGASSVPPRRPNHHHIWWQYRFPFGTLQCEHDALRVLVTEQRD